MKSLIIDDEFVSLMKLSSILSNYGECVHATHGKQSIDLFNKALKMNAPFNLVVIDIYLPDILGTKLLSYLNTKERKANVQPSIKIIITAKSSLKNVKEATKNHCNAFILKPIKKDNFLKKLIDLDLVEGEKTVDEPELTSDENEETQEIEADSSLSILSEAQSLETETKISNGVIMDDKIPPAEKEKLKKEIKAEKRELFKMCNNDRVMMRYFEAIVDEEIETRWHEQKTNNS